MSGAAENQGAPSHLHHDNALQQPTKSADGTAAASAENGNASSRCTEAESANGGTSDPAQGGESPQTAGSPEPNCAICLGTLENKSFTDSCFHMFCFVCLQEWSKVKAECPLCKQPFKSIIHNVRSYNKYDQFYLDHSHHSASRPYQWEFSIDRSFRFRTTLTMDHRYPRLPRDSLSYLRGDNYGQQSSVTDSSLQRPSQYSFRLNRLGQSNYLDSNQSQVWSRQLGPTTDFRRRLYENGYQVSGLQGAQRIRQVSPEFFRNNPAQTHRLVPWLNRELNALLYCHESQVRFVLELILDLIKHYPIDSEEFYQHIYPYIGRHTRHFVHEFLSFARSPLHMVVYDIKALYEPSSHVVSSSDSSDDNSDVVVIDDDDAEEAGRPAIERRREETSSASWNNEPPEVRRPLDPDFTFRSGTSRLQAMLEGLSSSNNSNSVSGWESPTPGPSWDLGGTTSSSPVNVVDSTDSDASTIIDPAYAPSQLTHKNLCNQNLNSDNSNSEDVIFIGYDKPWEERSPIMLSSGSDDEKHSKFSKKLKRNYKLKESISKQNAKSSGKERSLSSSSSRQKSRSPQIGQLESRHKRQSSSSNHYNRLSSSASNIHRLEKHRHKKRCHDSTEHFSLSQNHGEKHRSSSDSHSRSSRKRHHQDRNDSQADTSDHSRKKHKHRKKHKKSREKNGQEKHSRRHGEKRYKSSRSRRDSDARASSVEHDNFEDHQDSFKKHPSGHKKSRIHGCSDGEHCNSPSVCLTTESTSTATVGTSTSALTDGDGSPLDLRSDWSSAQMTLDHHYQWSNLPTVSPFPGLDVAPTWENIARLAGISFPASSHSFSEIERVPSSDCGLSTMDPLLVTSSSSDESDKEDISSKHRKDGGIANESNLGNNLNVARTVVVPCSSRMGVPTAAIDPAGTSSSNSATIISDYLGDDDDDDSELIDVDSLSSCDKNSDTSNEILDVESIDDKEDALPNPQVGVPAFSSSAVTEVSTESKDIPTPITLSSMQVRGSLQPPARNFFMDSILNRDVFMGVSSSSLPSCSEPVMKPSGDCGSFSENYSLCEKQSNSLSLELHSSQRCSANSEPEAFKCCQSQQTGFNADSNVNLNGKQRRDRLKTSHKSDNTCERSKHKRSPGTSECEISVYTQSVSERSMTDSLESNNTRSHIQSVPENNTETLIAFESSNIPVCGNPEVHFLLSSSQKNNQTTSISRENSVCHDPHIDSSADGVNNSPSASAEERIISAYNEEDSDTAQYNEEDSGTAQCNSSSYRISVDSSQRAVTEVDNNLDNASIVAVKSIPRVSDSYPGCSHGDGACASSDAVSGSDDKIVCDSSSSSIHTDFASNSHGENVDHCTSIESDFSLSSLGELDTSEDPEDSAPALDVTTSNSSSLATAESCQVTQSHSHFLTDHQNVSDSPYFCGTQSDTHGLESVYADSSGDNDSIYSDSDEQVVNQHLHQAADSQYRDSKSLVDTINKSVREPEADSSHCYIDSVMLSTFNISDEHHDNQTDGVSSTEASRELTSTGASRELTHSGASNELTSTGASNTAFNSEDYADRPDSRCEREESGQTERTYSPISSSSENDVDKADVDADSSSSVGSTHHAGTDSESDTESGVGSSGLMTALWASESEETMDYTNL